MENHSGSGIPEKKMCFRLLVHPPNSRKQNMTVTFLELLQKYGIIFGSSSGLVFVSSVC